MPPMQTSSPPELIQTIDRKDYISFIKSHPGHVPMPLELR